MPATPTPRAVAEEFFARMEDDRRDTVGELFADLAGDVMDHVGWRRRQSHTADNA